MGMKKHVKRLIALWLVLCLPLLAVGGAFAESESAGWVDLAGSIAAGNEVYTSIDYEWLDSMNLLGLPEEQLEVMASLYEAMDITTYSGVTEEGLNYESFNIYINGENVTYIDAVFDGETVYVNSPILTTPVALSLGQLEGLLNNVLAYAGVDMGDVVDPEMVAMAEAFATEIMNWINVLDVDGLSAALTTWAEEALIAELDEGEVVSPLGVTAVSGAFITISSEEFLALFQAVAPVLQANEELWVAIANSPLLPLLTEGAEVTPEEVLMNINAAFAEGLEMTAEDFEGLTILLGSYVDAEGNEVYGEICLIPDYDTPIIVQWLSDMTGFMLSYPDEYEGFEAILTLNGDETGGEIDLNISTTELVEDELVYTPAFNVNAALDVEPTDSGAVTGVRIAFTATQGGMDAGMEVLVTVEDYYGEVYASQDMDMAFNMLMMGQSMPIMAANAYSFTDDAPLGIPFDISEMEFIDLGSMTPEEFAVWVEEDVAIGLVQAVLNIAAHMPKEALTSVMGELSF
jgi:hypothetical protein